MFWIRVLNELLGKLILIRIGQIQTSNETQIIPYRIYKKKPRLTTYCI
jgi:hypothetical protein